MESRTPNRTTQGTGNPNSLLDDRSVDELRNIASNFRIQRRGKLRKAELVEAIREQGRDAAYKASGNSR